MIKRAKLIELPSSEIISKTENNYRGFSYLILSRKPLDEKHIKRYVYFEFGICNKECILIPNESEKVRTIILDKAKLKNRIQ